MEARTFPFDRGKCKRRAGREQHPLRIYDRASLPWRSSAGFFRLYIHFITHASSAVRLQCIRLFDDTHLATPCRAPPHFPLPIPSSALRHRPVARAVVSPFGALRLSDVLPEFNQKLTGNAVRSTSMNRAWVCGGDYDGAEHPGSGCGALRDYTSTLSPPPSRDTFPTHAHAPPPTFRMILRLLLTWTRSDCGGTVHSCDYTRGMAAPTHIRLATARAVALL